MQGKHHARKSGDLRTTPNHQTSMILNRDSLPLFVRDIWFIALLTCAAGAVGPTSAHAGGVPALLDDFSDAQRTNAGIDRLVIDDAALGGRSKARLSTEAGVLSVSGEIDPARGQPGFVSIVLLLAPDGKPQDLSRFEGIRIRVEATQGMLSVLAASTEVENYDYHASFVTRSSDGLQEIRIPFSTMKRLWSEQTRLNLGTVASINLVASGLEKGTFAYKVDEIGFY